MDARVTFWEFCTLLRQLSGISKHAEKRLLLERYFTRWRGRDGASSVYPFVRLLLPKDDKERGAYGLKEDKLARLYLDATGVDKASSDGLALLNWKAPATAKSAGDFSEVLYNALLARSENEQPSALSVREVNALLDELIDAERERQQDIVRGFFRACNPEEQKWLARLILRDLNVKVSTRTILSAYHPDADAAYNTHADLKQVVEEFQDPAKRSLQHFVLPFNRFNPMFADHGPKIEDIPELLGNEPFALEAKYDGERIQIHKVGDQYEYYTRRGQPRTAEYGASPLLPGSLTPRIHSLFDAKIDAVLDGEMLAYDPVLDGFLAFGTLPEASRNHDLADPNRVRPCFICFDVLFVNGNPTIDQPLFRRREVLERIFRPQRGAFELAPSQKATTSEEIVAFLNHSLMNLEEGIMVKRLSSVYTPGERDARHWIKLKPEYLQDIAETVTVLIMGAFYGQGHRVNLLSQFLLGVPDFSHKDGVRILACGRVGSGYNVATLQRMTKNEVAPHLTIGHPKSFANSQEMKWVPYDRKALPEGFDFGKENPDVYIMPEDSKVVEILASQFSNAGLESPTGLAFRFPRVVRFVEDQDWTQCFDLKRLWDFYESSKGRITSRAYGTPRKRAGAVTAGVSSDLKPRDVSHIPRVDRIFWDGEPMKIHILSMTNPQEKVRLEISIHQHGGVLTANPVAGTALVVAAKRRGFAVQAIERAGMIPVVSAEYIYDCIRAQMLLPLSKRYLMGTPPRGVQLYEDVDPYGDAYLVDVSAKQLWELSAALSGDRQADAGGPAEADLGDGPTSMFSRATVYLDDALPEAERTAAHSVLQLYGAHFAPSLLLNAGITHVLVDERTSNIAEIAATNAKQESAAYLVTADWIAASLVRGEMEIERNFQPVLKR